MKLAPIYMQSSGEYLGSAVLRRFQKELADIKEGAIVLSAPTGSGKTITLLTDSERGIAVGLYPNNELLCNQATSLDSFIRRYLNMNRVESSLLDLCRDSENLEYMEPLNIYEAERPVDLFGRKVSKINVAGLSGAVIRRAYDGGKLETLIKVSERLGGESTYNIVLGTPDTFFLLSLYLYKDFNKVGRLLSLLRAVPADLSIREVDNILLRSGFTRERLEKIAKVLLPFRRSTLFIDEYHLYGFYELASIKALAYVLRHAHDWEGRIVFSSATPRPGFAKEVTNELGLNVEEINAIDQVSVKGEPHELVRGPVKLVFYGVDTGGGSHISKLYRSSELAYKLLDYLKEYVDDVINGKARGAAILEKVWHAELFAEKFYNTYNIKPLCLFSMAKTRTDMCSQSYDEPFIVGTGAKIGQGVEYEGLTFGVVMRVSAPHLLQSISRIGRKYSEESTVLIPLDVTLLKEKEGLLRYEGEVTYSKLAEWAENDGKPLLREIPKGYERVYETLIKTREKTLKAVGLILHYRLSQARSQSFPSVYLGAVKALRNQEILASPDLLYNLLLFRATGPAITYVRKINNELICGREDFGVIIRNYEIRAPKSSETCTKGELAGSQPSLVIETGRTLKKGDCEEYVTVECDERDHLIDFIHEHEEPLIAWSALRDIFKCRLMFKLKCKGKHSQEVELKRLNEELEYAGQIFLVPRLFNEDFAEYIYRSGRGLMERSDIEKRTLTLIYI